MNESISVSGLEEYKGLTSHTVMDGFNRVLTGCREFPPSVLYALDLRDDDEIIVNWMVWVIDTNTTLRSVILQCHCKWKK